MIFTGCGSGGTSTSTSTPSPTTYTIGGTVSGLAGTGLVLQNNSGNNLTVTANGSFTFSTPIASGSAYNVTVLTQPSSPVQSCTVTSGSGTVGANVTSVMVTCVTAYTISGTLSGLVGTGLVLQDNATDNLHVTANGSFTFATSIASGSPFSITVLTQPYSPAQTCTVANASGTASANITAINVVCTSKWTWVGGSNVPNQPGVYGKLSTAALGNAPGARSGAVSWTDTSGNLWLYGGDGYDSAGNFGVLSDLWEFNQGTGEWGWITGSDLDYQAAVYAARGVAAPANTPGYGCCSMPAWTDKSGNFWLSGSLYSNDFWKFNPGLGSHGEWAWMGGIQGTSNVAIPGVYGDLGAPSSDNVPGERLQSVTWTDASGNLWLFGGYGADVNGTTGLLNDIWMFYPALGEFGEWAWMGGSANLPVSSNPPGVYGMSGQTGVYGTQGTAAPGNVPGGRWGSVSWTDDSGNLWLFGGTGFDSTGASGFLNDLWMFDPALGIDGEWAWMGGSNMRNQYGVYGIQGITTSKSVPGSRVNAVSWTDTHGNFWLFGGEGPDSTEYQGVLSDLWKYTPSTSGDTGKWTWMAGSNIANQQGVQDSTTSDANLPGGLQNATSWTDQDGNLWLFGGSSVVSTNTCNNCSLIYLNNLWEYKP
jgi:hypothetical protein